MGDLMRALVLAALTLSVGCATLFTADREDVTVTSAAPGARVVVDGHDYGATPTTVSLDKKQSHVVQIHLYDGRVVTCTINSTVGVGWVVLDVVFGLVPIIVDAVTGKWRSLDQTHGHAS